MFEVDELPLGPTGFGAALVLEPSDLNLSNPRASREVLPLLVGVLSLRRVLGALAFAVVVDV